MNSDELDRILDDALASYSLNEPREGLSGRVMARVRTEGAIGHGRWWLFAVAATALAGVTIAILMWRIQIPSLPVARTAPAVAMPAVAKPPVDEPPQVPALPEVSRRVATRPPAASLPRRGSLPSPAPLTPGERSLLAFAQQAPEAVRWLEQNAEPLAIEAISIRPLEIHGLPTGEDK